MIKYDWIVKPGGNPADIRFTYKNTKGTRIDEEGNLVIETEFGELVHKRPGSFQESKAKRQGKKGSVRSIVQVTGQKLKIVSSKK